jgi:hypothetical protein
MADNPTANSTKSVLRLRYQRSIAEGDGPVANEVNKWVKVVDKASVGAMQMQPERPDRSAKNRRGDS